MEVKLDVLLTTGTVTPQQPGDIGIIIAWGEFALMLIVAVKIATIILRVGVALVQGSFIVIDVITVYVNLYVVQQSSQIIPVRAYVLIRQTKNRILP
ncbi:MAG: hypothetical protein QW738_07765 [Nitrososphaeria archaeon]